ncbi:hypothetical protein AWM75_06760 [Aerococcus urinaehominis]|uniref:Uncharacterized protein n=1 Tax=Aerococcus urinaehominis TaxID=128944 RepID=A0A120IB05_9LACT|nr:Fur family transcriptional regulator [Aerococcus urinaehominis]AMB99701.1 hypothetical protein AWM75_06760 [Aerococcus urinaehominis]SDL91100.1 Fur family transcriptional regulator, ferric uptake regulator [Aerococcus urinaehominis]
METEELQTLTSRVQEAGFKLTPQRRTTIEVLADHDNKMLTAEEIYMAARDKNASIGLATVYRTLEILTELNILARMTFDDGQAHYSLKGQRSRHSHHYLLCTSCGRVEEVQEDMLSDLEKEVTNRYHFKISDHHLTMHGLCYDCQLAQMTSEIDAYHDHD